jgi:uncharacterized protein YegL
MKNNKTELVFILDKSGSMAGLETDTIGGFNAMLAKQKALEGDCRITTVLFDNNPELLHDRIDIQGVNPLTAEEYAVGGSTALLDAIGFTIGKIGKAQQKTAEGVRADKVLFVIITDGMENASREYSFEKVRQLIEYRKAEFSWEFIFLGANIDAAATAESFGIHRDRAQNYHADKAGVNLNYATMSENIAQFRKNAAMPADWKKKVEEDYKKRGGMH